MGLTGGVAGDDELDPDGDAEADDDEVDGDGLAVDDPWLVPTCAGGGNDSTVRPTSAWLIISCQADAAAAPNIGAPLSVTGLLRS